jgi:predicted MFS family arabinose efflux permease
LLQKDKGSCDSPFVKGLRNRLDESRKAFRAVFHNPELRKVQLAHIGSITGEWGYVVALLVYAEAHGGPKAVSLVLVLRWVSAALTSSWLAVLADRFRRERMMLAADLTRASIMAIMAIAAFSGWPSAVIYVGATLVSVASRAFYPAQQALLPTLARTPEELTAANVASSGIESVGAFAGPALGGLLLAATDTGTVFVATAATFVWSAFLVSRLRSSEQPEPVAAQETPGMLAEAVEGFRVLAQEPAARLIVGLYSVQTLVDGAMKVLLVVTALDLLDIGKSGLGFLNAAIGVGGLIGVGLTFALVGRNRLANDFGTGLLLMGLALGLIGVFPKTIAAIVLLGVLGIGNTIVDVSAVTLMQRAVRDEVLGRVFGALESLLIATAALGALLAPLLIDLAGIRTSLVVVGGLLVLVTVALWAKLRAIDLRVHVPQEVLELLRANPIFGPLPPPTVEHLAARLVPRTEEAGATIFRQGDHGDLFYLVETGLCEISIDGEKVATAGPGDGFGEIALLHDVPRTATVTAVEETKLQSLERDDFIAAVTGHAPSREAADAMIGSRLASVSGVASA